MYRTFVPNAKDINGCIDILKALNRSSVGSTRTQDNLTEIANLGLTCQIAGIMFAVAADKQLTGTGFTEYPNVRFSHLPILALAHAFEKYETCDIPRETYRKLFENKKELESTFRGYLDREIISLTSPELFNHIHSCDIGLEEQLYKASAALAEYYEVLELKKTVSEKTVITLLADRLEKLQEYREFPVINEFLCGNSESEYFRLTELFEDFSDLRNCIRWAKRNPARCFSVLGHSFCVAVYNYLFYLHSPVRAVSGFYVGLYHDIAEFRTGDIPNPLKDVVPGLRKRFEEVEVETLETKIFPLLPNRLVPSFKTVMLELLPEEEKDFFKLGDRIDANIEASAQLEAGSGDYRFRDVIINAVINSEKTSGLEKEVMKKIRKDARISYISVLHRKLQNILIQK